MQSDSAAGAGGPADRFGSSAVSPGIIANRESDAADRSGSSANRASNSTDVSVNWNSPMKEAMERLHSLDALEANTLSDNPQAMASWTVARTVVRTGGRKAVAKPSGPVPVIPAAA
jgi:hypothetical protein